MSNKNFADKGKKHGSLWCRLFHKRYHSWCGTHPPLNKYEQVKYCKKCLVRVGNETRPAPKFVSVAPVSLAFKDYKHNFDNSYFMEID